MRTVFSTLADVFFVLLIAGGIAMIYLPAGVISAGVLGLSISIWRHLS